ncbi:hypothetical protein ACHAAC_06690 [Aeromicrobium sp. CF4.19]|uniref:phage terminase small subunit n=1 Tax=Aeromicrobium sp. CF4.19 TaxID=3373082 RepID=UPI003EE80E43
MPTLPNRSEDLTSAGERKRKERDTTVARGRSIPATLPEPDPQWCTAARMIWDSMLESGGAAYFESSDYAVLHLTADQIDHLYQQGGRRSPEYLRVIMQTLGSLLATEGDRRRLRIELQDAPDDDEGFLAGLEELFADA